MPRMILILILASSVGWVTRMSDSTAQETEASLTWALYESSRGGEPLWTQSDRLPTSPESSYLLRQLQAHAENRSLWLEIELDGKKLGSRIEAPPAFMSWQALDQSVAALPTVESFEGGTFSLSGCPIFEALTTIEARATSKGQWLVDVSGFCQWTSSGATLELGLSLDDSATAPNSERPRGMIRANASAIDRPSYTPFHLATQFPAPPGPARVSIVARTLDDDVPPQVHVSSFRITFMPDADS